MPAINFAQQYVGPTIGGYPAPFDPRFIHSQYPNALDVLTAHSRWNLTGYTQAFGGADFLKIGIVRKPLDQFVSSFSYFYSRIKNKEALLKSRGCSGHPFLDVMQGELHKSINDYLEAQKSVDIADKPWAFRSLNHQSFDFNLPYKSLGSDLEIKNRLLEFDVVIVLERLHESLIIMKSLLCMAWGDIVPYLKVRNAVKHSSAEQLLSRDEQEIVLRKLVKSDVKLYALANEKLDNQISDFGENRMAKELEILDHLIVLCKENSDDEQCRPSNYDVSNRSLLKKSEEWAIQDVAKAKDIEIVKDLMLKNGGSLCSWGEDGFL